MQLPTPGRASICAVPMAPTRWSPAVDALHRSDAVAWPVSFISVTGPASDWQRARLSFSCMTLRSTYPEATSAELPHRQSPCKELPKPALRWRKPMPQATAGASLSATYWSPIPAHADWGPGSSQGRSGRARAGAVQVRSGQGSLVKARGAVGGIRLSEGPRDFSPSAA